MRHDPIRETQPSPLPLLLFPDLDEPPCPGLALIAAILAVIAAWVGLLVHLLDRVPS